MNSSNKSEESFWNFPWRRKNSLLWSPPTSNPCYDSRRGNTTSSRPFLYTPFFSSNLKNYCCSSVLSLLKSCCPFQIQNPTIFNAVLALTAGIITIVIYSLKGKTNLPCWEQQVIITDECLQVPANLNSSTSIIFKRWALGIHAASLHREPSLVKLGILISTTQAVSNPLCGDNFLVKASARPRESLFKGISRSYMVLSAVTYAIPKYLGGLSIPNPSIEGSNKKSGELYPNEGLAFELQNVVNGSSRFHGGIMDFWLALMGAVNFPKRDYHSYAIT